MILPREKKSSMNIALHAMPNNLKSTSTHPVSVIMPLGLPLKLWVAKNCFSGPRKDTVQCQHEAAALSAAMNSSKQRYAISSAEQSRVCLSSLEKFPS